MITVNNKKYNIPELDFNAICELEGMGVSLTEIKKTPTSALRAFFALCLDGDKELAGSEIQAHMISGGKLDVLSEALGKAVSESGFFQALNQNKKTETPTVEAPQPVVEVVK